MANWGNMVELVNRTSKPLNVRWDGKDVTLDPNYDAAGKEIPGIRNMVPPHVVFYAKNQNILMGSEDPIDPSLDAAQCLVGVRHQNPAKQKDDISYCEQSDNPTRVDLAAYLDDPNLKIHQGRGKHKMSEAVIPVAPGRGGDILANAQ